MELPGVILGAVLAGGLSQRMGSDKADLRLEGEPAWRRQVDTLRAVGMSRVVLIRRPGQPSPEGIECWRDVAPGSVGPMGGLHAALLEGTADWVALLAIDMPAIGPAWFSWLSTFCRPHVGAMARHVGGSEPLAALYPAGALAEVSARIATGDYSLRRMAEALVRQGRMVYAPLPGPLQGQVANLNTPDEFQAWTGGTTRTASADISLP